MATRIELGNIWTVIKTDDLEVRKIAKESATYTLDNWEYMRKSWLGKLERSGEQFSSEYLRLKSKSDNLLYGSSEHDKILKHINTLKTENNHLSKQYKRALDWRGEKFLGTASGSRIKIPSGCMRGFLQRTFQYHNTFERYDKRDKIIKIADWELSDKKTPRTYQDDACNTAIKNGSGIIQVPTGGGKTYIMSMLLAHYKTTALINVPTKHLLYQIRDEILENLMIDENDVGIIGDGKYDPSVITVAINATLASMLKRRKDDFKTLMGLHAGIGWGLYLVDEAQYLGADSYYGVSMNVDAPRRFGFSATPLQREDGANLRVEAATGHIIYSIKSEELIEGEWLCPPKITFIPVKPITFDHNDRWMAVRHYGIIVNRSRNEKIIDIANQMYQNDRSTLIFVDLIEHGKELKRLASQHANHPIEFVHGTDKQRQEKIEKFKNKEIKTLISTEGIIGVGFDFRELDAIIMGDGGKSEIATIQKVGRGLRIADNKEEVLVFDFADRAKYLTDHARKRLTTWSKMKFKIDASKTPYII